ncbi:MAG: serine/threonine protein kinase [Anaerolineae bacterium]|nr:serine/threonine protein kinase [Anaerolineae bacterium]
MGIQDQDLAGKIIKSYELRDMIGKGSFGAVYSAYHIPVKRDVAVKVILPEYANHPDFIRRFESEAQLVARVEHPYIIPLFDYWREPNSAFLVMRYLRGGSLRDLLSNQGPLDVEVVARILDQVTAALTVAHNQGVVHRDLKPGNILLDEQGNGFLADFGIAKDLRIASDATLQGALVGSPSYLSPEQVRSEEVSPQADIYSLGIVLYEMLTATKPFSEDSGISMLLIHQLNDPLPNVRDKTPRLFRRSQQGDPAGHRQGPSQSLPERGDHGCCFSAGCAAHRARERRRGARNPDPPAALKRLSAGWPLAAAFFPER